MAIRVARNAAGNCVVFYGQTNPVYFNACLSAEVVDTDYVSVINDIASSSLSADKYEFYRVHYSEWRDSDNTAFASAQATVDYINSIGNVANNQGQFVLSATDTLDFSLDSTETTVLLDNGDSYPVNAIRAAGNEDGHINILQHLGDVSLYSDLRVANASIDGTSVNATLATAVNELNAFFQRTGSSSGDAPTISSATTVNMNEGDTLNYELIATNGVGYEWTNLPSGVTTVDGNTRKLIGGSSLTVGTYTVTAKAINYFGEDSEDIDIVVSTPPYSNTKSVKFSNSDYLGGNAAQMDAALGRSANGAGSGDAWTISFWFKPGTDTSGQTIFYYGSNDTTNGAYIELRYVGSTNKLRLRYGSGNNYIQINTPNSSLTSSTWQHVLVTYDGGTTGASSGSLSSYYGRFGIYIDGTLQTPTNTHGNYGWSGAVSGQNFRLGRFSSGNYMKSCFMDELAIWSSDQTANVSDIYNSGSTHDLEDLTTSPDHYWRMGDGNTYPIVQDIVGGVHFVMYNMTAADLVNDVP
jgi:hypothetical protein